MATEQQRAAIREHLARMMTPELAEAFMESFPPHRWDHLATKDDVGMLRSDLEDVRGDVALLQADVGVLKADVGVLKAGMVELNGEMAGFSIRLEESEQRGILRGEAMEHRITGEMRRLYVDQTRLLFFSMLGAIFTTATLAFAAVRF